MAGATVGCYGARPKQSLPTYINCKTNEVAVGATSHNLAQNLI